jgi:RNA polymerase sigma factor (sigma-70 family)
VNNLTDQELLRDFVTRRSETAFADLVHRHVDLVYSAALRMVCDAHLAQDVTQGVFIALAKSAPQLADRPILSGWLHRTAQNIAANTVRSEVRRHTREQEAAAMNELLGNEPDTTWEMISAHLDTALGELDESDRDALMLRYFERKSSREMAAILGTSEEAAQKRVTRATERLRELFSKRRLAIGAAGLAALISANAVQSAPIGLASAISAAVLTGAAIQSSAFLSATKTIAMTTIQKSIIVAALASVAGTGIYAARQNAQLHGQIETLQQQQEPLTAQIQELQQDRDDATNQLAALLAKSAQSESNSNQNELSRLRAEITRLESQQDDPTALAAKTLMDKVNMLKQRLAATPGATIPEMKLLTDEDWLSAANCKLDTDTDYRRAMADLRTAAESKVVPILKSALQAYLQANNQQFPTDISQLEPYFTSPMDQAILDRWEVTSPSTIPSIGVGSGGIITEKTAVDEIFDSRVAIGADGYGTADFLTPQLEPQLQQVMKAYQAANNGGEPTDVSQILPYATTPEQQAAVQKMILKNSK